MYYGNIIYHLHYCESNPQGNAVYRNYLIKLNFYWNALHVICKKTPTRITLVSLCGKKQLKWRVIREFKTQFSLHMIVLFNMKLGHNFSFGFGISSCIIIQLLSGLQ